MLQGKIKFKDTMSMDPKMLAIILFHFFPRERVFLFSFCFYKGFLFLIFIVHQIFTILAKLKQGQDKTARIKKRHFHKILILNSWKLKSASIESCANFIIWNASKPCLISSTNLRTFPNKFEKFLEGVCPKRFASKVYGSITPKFINQNFDTMPNLIKEGYLT